LHLVDAEPIGGNDAGRFQLFQSLQAAIHQLAKMHFRLLDTMRVGADVVNKQDVYPV
jgi:hypothetical protein